MKATGASETAEASKMKATGASETADDTEEDHEGFLPSGEDDTKKKTSHYNTAYKKFNSVGSIWKTAEKALEEYHERQAEAKNSTTPQVAAAEMEQYLSGKRPSLKQIVLPVGNHLKQAAGATGAPSTDYMEVQAKKNPFTAM